MSAEYSIESKKASNDILYEEFVSKLNDFDFDITQDDFPEPEVSLDSERDAGLLARMRGSLLGLAVGDAVGGPFEFEPRSMRVRKPAVGMIDGGSHNLRLGEWTDDTALALCLAVSLICKGHCDQVDQLTRYNWWREKGYLSSRHQCFDIGNLTVFALRTFVDRRRSLIEQSGMVSRGLGHEHLVTETAWKQAGLSVRCGHEYPGRGAGNGSLMRLAPVPLFYLGHRDEAIESAALSSETTHDDPVAVEACQLYTALIMGALEGLSKEVLLSTGFYEEYTQRRLITPPVIEITKGSYKTEDDARINGAGYVAFSLEAALWAFYNDGGSFERGVLLAINLGDDTDTTAAIYGQLAGAAYGVDAIPLQWRDNLLHAGAILKVVSWIFHVREDARRLPGSGFGN